MYSIGAWRTFVAHAKKTEQDERCKGNINGRGWFIWHLRCIWMFNCVICTCAHCTHTHYSKYNANPIHHVDLARWIKQRMNKWNYDLFNNSNHKIINASETRKSASHNMERYKKTQNKQRDDHFNNENSNSNLCLHNRIRCARRYARSGWCWLKAQQKMTQLNSRISTKSVEKTRTHTTIFCLFLLKWNVNTPFQTIVTWSARGAFASFLYT